MAADPFEKLQSLLTAEIDARNGYSEAVKDAKGGHDLIGLFRDMLALHGQNSQELIASLRKAGVEPDEKASLMSVIHRTIMDVRALVGGLDRSVLPGLIDGETRNSERYQDAIDAAIGDSQLQSMLERQQLRITEALARMRSMKEAAG